MSKQYDVIVVGAGVAGSSCALQLAKQGHRTLLLDRQAFPRHKACGEFMSPETKEMLECLDVRLLGQKLRPVIMDHARIIMPHGGEISASLPGKAYGISRFELDRLLQEKALAAGSELATRTAVTDIRLLDGYGYEVEAKQGNERIRYRARAVIGACGGKQTRGVSASAEPLREETAYVGVKSHYSGIAIPSRVELYFCEGGYVGISPIERGAVNVAALLTLEHVRESGKSVPDILRAAACTNKKLAERIAEGVPVPGTQVSVAPVRLSALPDPWSHYPHIGDAMMTLPPLCGDGMSVALRSSLLCARWTDHYLRGAISRRDWQHEYTKEANLAFTQLLKRARSIQRLAFAKTNRFYPGIVRLVPGLAAYLIKATRLRSIGYND